MLKIEAIFRPERVNAVCDALVEEGVNGFHYQNVTGQGQQAGIEVVTGRGGATTTAKGIIFHVTGMKEGKGYNAKHVSWPQADSIFLDGGVDASVRPGMNPPQWIPIYEAAGKVVIVSVPKATNLFINILHGILIKKILLYGMKILLMNTRT